jgi:hypothetical protein
LVPAMVVPSAMVDPPLKFSSADQTKPVEEEV